MYYNKLNRLPNETTVGFYKEFIEDTQALVEEEIDFMFAFESNDTDSAITVLDGSLFTNITGPMTILTSSDIKFKVSDHIKFYGIEKQITAVTNIYSNQSVRENILYQRNDTMFYRRLTLS